MKTLHYMALFTEVPFEEAAAFLRPLGLGDLRAQPVTPITPETRAADAL
ncbi:hypothetical protein [Polaromonas sp. C04]|nr:hypothetical protein [Polaromonas sp. C04]